MCARKVYTVPNKDQGVATLVQICRAVVSMSSAELYKGPTVDSELLRKIERCRNHGLFYEDYRFHEG